MNVNEMLYCVNIEDNAGEFSAAAEFLNAAELDFSSYENKETKTVHHTVYALTEAPAKGQGYPLQYSGLENSMDCIVCGVTKSRTRINKFHYY